MCLFIIYLHGCISGLFHLELFYLQLFLVSPRQLGKPRCFTRAGKIPSEMSNEAWTLNWPWQLWTLDILVVHVTVPVCSLSVIVFLLLTLKCPMRILCNWLEIQFQVINFIPIIAHPHGKLYGVQCYYNTFICLSVRRSTVRKFSLLVVPSSLFFSTCLSKWQLIYHHNDNKTCISKIFW